MIRCPKCLEDFSPLDSPCRKCLGAGLVLAKDKHGVGPEVANQVAGPAKRMPCPRCNGNGTERSSSNRHNRSKGAANEAKAVKIFTDWWEGPKGEKYQFKRTPQSGGSALAKEFVQSGDICSTDPNWPFSVECKRDKAWDLSQLFTVDGAARLGGFMKQSINDAPPTKIAALWLQHPGPSQPTFIMLLHAQAILRDGITVGRVELDEGFGITQYVLMSLKKFLAFGPSYWRNFHSDYKELHRPLPELEILNPIKKLGDSNV